MSDTPRTDALIPKDDEIESNAQEYVDLCRKLERELAESERQVEWAGKRVRELKDEFERLTAEVGLSHSACRALQQVADDRQSYVEVLLRKCSRLEEQNEMLSCRARVLEERCAAFDRDRVAKKISGL